MNRKSKVAVVGLGNIGKVIATNLVRGNRLVIVADRSIEKASRVSLELGSLAEPKDISSALKEADIIVLAVWFEAIKELFKTYATELQGKIIIDPSNPIAPDENGGFRKTIPEDQSAGEILASLLPKDARIAKAFGTLGAASLASASFQKPESAVLFYASDDEGSNPGIEQLIRDSGFEPVRIGGIEQSVRIEVFGDLHEFGALGKTVTLAEAGQSSVMVQD
jgi:hypothetical protein